MMNLAKLGNDQWIARYAKGIRILGILMILTGTIMAAGAIMSIFVLLSGHEIQGLNPWLGLDIGVGVCVLGFLVIALSHLLMYTVGTRQKPGLVLRMANWGLFLLAGLWILGWVLKRWFWLSRFQDESDRPAVVTWMDAWPLMVIVSVALIFVALGLTLRRVLPVIEESKAVV